MTIYRPATERARSYPARSFRSVLLRLADVLPASLRTLGDFEFDVSPWRTAEALAGRREVDEIGPDPAR